MLPVVRFYEPQGAAFAWHIRVRLNIFLFHFLSPTGYHFYSFLLLFPLLFIFVMFVAFLNLNLSQPIVNL